jgi:hypothetical protein
MFNTPKTEDQKRKESEEKRRRELSRSLEDDIIYSAAIFSIVESDSAGNSSCSSDSDFSSGSNCGD